LSIPANNRRATDTASVDLPQPLGPHSITGCTGWPIKRSSACLSCGCSNSSSIMLSLYDQKLRARELRILSVHDWVGLIQAFEHGASSALQVFHHTMYPQ